MSQSIQYYDALPPGRKLIQKKAKTLICFVRMSIKMKPLPDFSTMYVYNYFMI